MKSFFVFPLLFLFILPIDSHAQLVPSKFSIEGGLNILLSEFGEYNKEISSFYETLYQGPANLSPPFLNGYRLALGYQLNPSFNLSLVWREGSFHGSLLGLSLDAREGGTYQWLPSFPGQFIEGDYVRTDFSFHRRIREITLMSRISLVNTRRHQIEANLGFGGMHYLYRFYPNHFYYNSIEDISRVDYSESNRESSLTPYIQLGARYSFNIHTYMTFFVQADVSQGMLRFNPVPDRLYRNALLDLGLKITLPSIEIKQREIRPVGI